MKLALLASALLAVPCICDSFDIITLPHNGLVPNGQSYRAHVSRNGRFVSFVANGTNVALGSGWPQVYISDRLTGQLEPISISLTGGPGDDLSLESSISDDGRFIAFESGADNLAVEDVPNPSDIDIFVRDRATQTTYLISRGIGGAPANDYSANCSISGDGRFVAFFSAASNLVPGDTNGKGDGFVFDRLLNTMQRVTVSETGVQSNEDSFNTVISRDGTKVYFDTDAALVASDTNNSSDIYVRDLVANTTRRVSLTNTGGQANFGSFSPQVSSDGRYVSFGSLATNLVAGDKNGRGDAFVRDDLLGTTTLVSVSTTGVQANDDAGHTVISGNGRFIVFHSRASNLVPGDNNGALDVFIRDLDVGTTSLLSKNVMGNIGNGDSIFAFVSANGRFTVFSSSASNLTIPPGTTQSVYGVDLAERQQVTGLQVIRGIAAGGNLASIQSSDNSYLVLRPGVTFSTIQAPIEVVTSANTTILNPRSLEFWIESRATSPSIRQVIELYDFDSTSYIEMNADQLTTNDRVTSIQVDEDAARFVSISGEVRARVSCRATGPVFSYPWETRIDHVQWFIME